VYEEQDRRGGGVQGHSVATKAGLVALGVSERSGPRSLESFLQDRQAEHWYAGQPVRAGEPVSQVINRFSPRSLPPGQWARIEALVRESVRQASPVTAHTAEGLMTKITQLAAWVDTIGQPLEPEVVFHPDTIDRFVVDGCTHLAPGTRNNYRSDLRSVGEGILGPEVYPPAPLQLPKPDPLAPYSSREVAALYSWARGLPTARYRDNVGVILGLGLGAGLHSQEINRLVGTDIAVDRDGVLVQVIGERERSVPVLREFEAEVAALTRLGDAPVFLPERTSIGLKQVPNFIARCPEGSVHRPNVNRLRNTWVVRHLSGGTHLSALAEAAGVRADQLVRYQKFATGPDPAAARRQLRDP
jgi:hypothetical protein